MASHPPRIVRRAVASARIVRRINSGISALHGGLWLGLLDDKALAQSTQEHYARNILFLDTNHSLSGLYNWEQECIARHAPPSGRVLVPAAGAGREVLALTSLGYEAIGYDPSPDLVEFGNRIIEDTGSDATLLLVHGNDLPPDIGPRFDWILFGWAGVNHIRGRQCRASVFKALFDALEPNGVLIVSFNERDPDDRQLKIEHRLGGWIRRLRRVPAAVEPGDAFNGYFSHLFTFDEISSELGAIGFAEIDRTRMPFPVIIAQKR